ncbi:hypothetical protein O3G_MSEX005501 [Manduca sexta]|uniref:Uncharacterized protein n=1 Tax=Manduca sexta TaxID=7130 RepID=A0A921Z159_MANSE|nr:hypothetical protein O3G_MSEX005501 [Manduca sexta]KAG6448413.1 hypothetical protein O3G_MSEX005501 [Manduca sexta]
MCKVVSSGCSNMKFFGVILVIMAVVFALVSGVRPIASERAGCNGGGPPPGGPPGGPPPTNSTG